MISICDENEKKHKFSQYIIVDVLIKYFRCVFNTKSSLQVHKTKIIYFTILYS